MERLKGKVKKLNKETITVVASSNSQDRDGDVLDVNGWDLKNFQSNPVLLWSHDAHSLPIGKVLDVHVEGNDLIAEVKFAEHDFAKDVEKLVRGGFLNTTSVGFMPLETDERDNVSSRQELLELSFVNVPANPEATVRREYKEFQAKVKSLEEKEDEAKKEEKKEEKVIEEKSGRIISEKNRNILRIGKDALLSSVDAIDELLEISNPEAK